jgi:hypothetical protein
LSEFNEEINKEINTVKQNTSTINSNQTTTLKNKQYLQPMDTQTNRQSSSSDSLSNDFKREMPRKLSFNEVLTLLIAGELVSEARRNYKTPNGYASSDYDYFNDYDQELSVKALRKSEKIENIIRAQKSKDLIKEIEGSEMERLRMERLNRERIQKLKEPENTTPGGLSQIFIGFSNLNPYLKISLAVGATSALTYVGWKMFKKIKGNQKQSPHRFSNKVN